MAGVSIEVTGLDSVLGALGRLTQPVRRDTLDEVGQYLVSEITDLFRRGAAPDGTPWVPSLRARLEGGKTLLDRGHLRDSFTHQADDAELVVGTNDKRARIHQFGGVIRPRGAGRLHFVLADGRHVAPRQVTMPARPMLPQGDLPADWRAEVLDIVRDHIQGAADGR